MKYPYFIFLCFFFISISCGKTDESDSTAKNSRGQIEFLPPIWINTHTESGRWLDYSSSTGGNWIFGNIAVVPFSNLEGKMTLRGFDISSGELIWEWGDFFYPEQEAINGRYIFEEDGILHWKTGNKAYWVDVRNGTTVQKYETDTFFTIYRNDLNGTIYWNGIETDSLPGLKVTGVFTGDFYEPSPTLTLLPDVDTTKVFADGRATSITTSLPVVIDGQPHLVVGWQQIFPPQWIVQSYMGLYNLDEKEWVYNNIVLGEQHAWGNIENPFVKNDNTIISNIRTKLFCYNYLTGQEIWSKEFDHKFTFSGYEISDGILVANCENGVLFGINPETGQTIWTGEGAGTSSYIHDRILNGVVYFVGGSSKYFHAVDIQTGQTLWKLDPDRYQETSNTYWNVGTVYCADLEDEKNGYIIIQNALNTYCFEAAK